MLFLPWVASTQAVRNDLSRSLLTCILILYRVIWYLSYIDILVYTWWIVILYIFMLNKFCLSPESWVTGWIRVLYYRIYILHFMWALWHILYTCMSCGFKHNHNESYRYWCHDGSHRFKHNHNESNWYWHHDSSWHVISILTQATA